MDKTKRYGLGARIFCKSWEQLLTTGLILSSKGYGVNVIGHEDMMNDVLTITALPEEKDDQISDMRVTERMKEQEPCDTCGYEEGSIYCKEHCPHEAKKEQEPYKVSEYDKDHIWYRGVQYISLRRFLEAKTEEKNINSVLEDIKAEIKEWYWQADKQAIAKDPCVVDAMIDLFIRTIDAHISSDPQERSDKE